MRHRSFDSVSRRAAAGFTIPELLVVISIMLLLFTVGLPNLKSLFKSARGESGPQIVSAAAATARAYATRSPYFSVGDYQGTAIIVTPANELRIAEHNPSATGPIGDPQSQPPNLLSGAGNAGYSDVPGLEYVQLPEDTGLVGVVRDDTGGLKLLAPPFAIRYNRMGNLVAFSKKDVASGGGSTQASAFGSDFVYYDGFDYNGQYANSNPRGRAATYDPKDYDPGFNLQGRTTRNYDTTRSRFKLPFEELETVVGVIFFSRSELEGMSGGSGYPNNTTESMLKSAGGKLTPAVTTWLLQNGQLLMFNRYTGAATTK
jgi:prepilin-type N-terminal cleavage/methylation domain-containing protein